MAKIFAKARNAKTNDLYAMATKDDGSFAVFKLCKNYDGQVRGGIRLTWRTVGKFGQRLDEMAARALYNRRVGRIAASPNVEA